MQLGIDISENNGTIDWGKVKSSGVSFTILRDGYGRSTLDKQFNANVKNAKANGIKIEGVYHFSYALNEADAKNEAVVCINHLQNAGLGKDVTVFFDLEYDSIRYASQNGVTINSSKCILFTKAFCDEVRRQGYKPGVYANGDYYSNYYANGNGIPSDAVFWYADWRNTPSEVPYNKASYWQYSDKGKINGIYGNVDTNYKLKDISHKTVSYKSLTESEIQTIAKEVIAGKYGNGEERKTKLTEAGYDYSVIQGAVNKLVASPKPANESAKKESKYTTEELVQKVINGEYGNGEERKKKLEAEGYDYNTVQSAVNKAIAPGHKSVSPAKSFDKSLSGKYEVTASALNMRYIPGLLTTNNVIKILYNSYKVQCWGYYTEVGNSKWLLIEEGNYTGFVDSRYLKKLS